MTAAPQVTLRVATPTDAAVLSNLLELYIHDLSATFGLDVGADGRFGYPKLPLYWSEPERRFPFLIHCGSKLAGFALITRGSPASDNPNDLDIAEYFVLRRYRRSSVGKQAAFLLWNRLPGHWFVRVSEGNQTGCDFWTTIITEYTGGALLQSARPGNPHAWRVFSFDSTTSL
jgi:predicted acetyltransferase